MRAKVKGMDVNWVDVIPAGLAIVILGGGLFMLISGAWAARDK